jgi:rubrerythrin
MNEQAKHLSTAHDVINADGAVHTCDTCGIRLRVLDCCADRIQLSPGYIFEAVVRRRKCPACGKEQMTIEVSARNVSIKKLVDPCQRRAVFRRPPTEDNQ